MAKHPELTPITSSALSAYHHDADGRKLYVQFKNGATWRYDDVPAERVEAFTGAASPGGYFSAKIRDQYKGTKL